MRINLPLRQTSEPSTPTMRTVCGSMKFAVPRKRSTLFERNLSSIVLRSPPLTCCECHMKSPRVASRRRERSTPKSRRECQPESASAVSRSVLLGTVPELRPAPPISCSFSISATCAPKIAAELAPLAPAGPAPMTIKSCVFMAGGSHRSHQPNVNSPRAERDCDSVPDRGVEQPADAPIGGWPLAPVHIARRRSGRRALRQFASSWLVPTRKGDKLPLGCVVQ